MILGKIVAAITVDPLVLVDALISGILLYGIFNGRKWAYFITFVFVFVGAAVALGKSVQNGLIVVVLNCLVLVPVLICSQYFFPNELAKIQTKRPGGINVYKK
jgi:hypothetical protein